GAAAHGDAGSLPARDGLGGRGAGCARRAGYGRRTGCFFCRGSFRAGAELRVKAGLILGEVADKEGIQVSPEELEMRLMLLKGQYQDATMQAELDKPENVRDIASRLLTEKTLDKLKSYAQSK
ncbi:MAG TPA: hypothetical protein VFI84_03260, partial [Candidatus Saccharimonadales bacterium]|nr:hypothetical protein [Candidatus Saccharimonadales bacterium]